MSDIKQKIAEQEAKLARLKDKAKKQDTAQKVVIGGMILAYSKKNPNNAKRLLEIMHAELREQDLKRVQGAMSELNMIIANGEFDNNHQGDGYANS